jgi:hypothetical protein
MHQFILNFLFVVAVTPLCAQKVSGKLQFATGEKFTVNMEIKNTVAQQAGGQAIDFLVTGSLAHHYRITDAGSDNTTLHHELDALDFQFQGMGQKRSFDSKRKKDTEDVFEKQFEELLAGKYDLVIDRAGKTIKVVPEKIVLTSQDERLAIVTDMLSDLTSVVHPPKKESPSFFAVLPAREIAVGDKWTDSIKTENQKTVTISILSAITDSTIIVDFNSTSVSNVTTQRMGRPARTNLTNITTGKIILNRKTGIIREKTSVTESNGTTEAMGGSLPITGKTFITITVRRE